MLKKATRILALLLCLCLLLTGMPGFAALAVGDDEAPADSGEEASSPEIVDIDPSSLGVKKLGEIDESQPDPDLSGLTPDTSLKELVRVSVFLEDPSALDAGYSAQGIGRNGSAGSYRAALLAKQKSVQKTIESTVGYKLNVVWNLTLLTNAFSTYVYGKDIPAIERIKGVVAVERETQYQAVDPVPSEPDTANTSVNMVGASEAWAAGYTGAGTRIAIIDTGIDTSHQSFDEDAFDYAIGKVEETTGEPVDLLTEDDIPFDYLNGSEGVYISSKIPFAYNYVDENVNIGHLYDTEGEHGSHVAGIAAANRFVDVGGNYEDAAEAVHAVGMAPDAQILVMKVFGQGGGAYDSDYIAAIEDAIIMEADAINLSLGSPNPGFSNADYYQDVLNALADGEINAGAVVSISAGNDGAITDNLYTDLFVDDVSLHTGGTPGTYTNSLCVASADNTGSTGAPLRFNDAYDAYITESESKGGTVGSIPGTYDFVYIDNLGTEEDYETVNAKIGLRGKVVIVNRGELTFVEKGNNAIPYSPAAVLIANNVEGTIGMLLDDFEGSFPMATITLADALSIIAISDETEVSGITCYTGKVEITSVIQHQNYSDRSEAVMSSFSSWGVPGSLLMKPEITAPGGSIYSVAGTYVTKQNTIGGGSDQYELLSGTSMAAPHIAGMAALAAQYLNDDDTDIEKANPALAEGYSRRAIIQSLLMSTATPMTSENNYGEYTVSVLQQGAGLADVSKAISASSVVMMKDAGLTTETGAAADGKVKVELGDDPGRTGEYSYTFTLYNLTDTDLSYDLSTDLFTQDLYYYYYYDILDEEWNYRDDGTLFMDQATTGLGADVSYSFAKEASEPHDVNGDGYTDDEDAQAVLDYLSGEDDGSGLDLAAGEMDDDGKLSTHDAYLILQYVETLPDVLTVKAHSSKDVKVTISLAEEDMEVLDYYYTSGAYVEGFTTVECTTATAEGVDYGHVHTIPILGFYGSWTEPSMFDNTSYTDLLYGTYLFPYSGSADTNYLTIKYNGTLTQFSGNPYTIEEDGFPADVLAVNSKSPLVKIYYNLLRASATTGFAVSAIDKPGGNVTEVLDAAIDDYEEEGLWFYATETGGSWQNTATQSYSINKTPASYGLKDGDTFRVGYYAIPEYSAMMYNGEYMNDAYGGMIYYKEELADLIASNTLGSGSFVGYDFTVDDGIPEISEIALDLEKGELTVSASDNLNLAYVAVLSIDGEDVYCKAVPHDPGYSDTLDISKAIEEAEGYVAIFAADYAGNEVAKALKVNDNGSVDPYAVESVAVTPESLDIYKGNEADLSVEVLPLTVEDRGITWTSSDETVAVVDETGHVTAVGKGKAVITATSSADETKKCDVPVNVECVDNALNALVWDENGEVYFSSFNTATLPEWTRLHDDRATAELRTTFIASDSTLYAADLDTSTGVTTLYTVNPKTFELTEFGENYMWASDIAAGASDAYGIDEMIGMVYSYAYLLVAGSVEPMDLTEYGFPGLYTGVPNAMLDLSESNGGSYIAGVAQKVQTADGGTYYVLDEDGVIWETTLAYNEDWDPYDEESEEEPFIFSTPREVIDTGIATDFLYQDLYYDGTYIYWSHYENDVSTLYLINPKTGTIYDAGNFGDAVWPVSGIYKPGVSAAESDTSASVKLPDGFTPSVISRDALLVSGAAARLASHNAKPGSLNTVKAVEKIDRRSADKQRVSGDAAVIDDAGTTTIVTLTEDTEVTNGLVTVSYTEGLSFVNALSPIYYSAHVDEDARIVTLAYAAVAAVPADKVFAELVFEIAEPGQTETISVEVAERNENVAVTDEEAEEIVINEPVPEFKSQSLILSGEIGVNFYMDLSVLDEETRGASYVEFTVGKGNPEKVPFNANKTNKKGYFGFTCYVRSIEMADTISAVYHYGDGKTVTKEYSVVKYIEAIEKNASNYSAKMVALAHAIADYGHYAQPYLADVNGWTVGDEFAEMTLHFTDEYDYADILSKVQANAFAKAVDGSTITKATYKLHLDTDTVLDVLLTTSDGAAPTDVTVTTRDEETGKETTVKATPFKDNQGRYVIRITGISAHRLGNMMTITGTAGTRFTIEVSPLSFVRSILNNASQTEEAKDCVSALYAYYAATMAYRA